MKKIALFIISAVASLSMMAQSAPTDTIKASYPGGATALKEYIDANRKYPATALRNGIEGVVGVRFIVKTDGSRDKLSIIRLVDPDLEAEAMRIVNAMPAWLPATLNGKPIDSETEVQVAFELPE